MEIVQFLCDVGVDLSDRNIKGWKVLMLAAIEEQLEVLRLLHDAGANLFSLGDDDGQP